MEWQAAYALLGIGTFCFLVGISIFAQTIIDIFFERKEDEEVNEE